MDATAWWYERHAQEHQHEADHNWSQTAGALAKRAQVAEEDRHVVCQSDQASDQHEQANRQRSGNNAAPIAAAQGGTARIPVDGAGADDNLPGMSGDWHQQS